METDLNTYLAVFTALKVGDVKSDTLLGRFLGPSIDYLGQGLRNCIERSFGNISKILSYSLRIFESKDDDGGIVNPRVLRHIINEGIYCEDDLTCAYFGGVLASSRNKDFIDDRGLNFTSLLESMSSYQIRAHYIFYTFLRKKHADYNISLEVGKIENMDISLPWDEFLDYMNLNHCNDSKLDLLLPHIFSGLNRLGLISSYGYGNISDLALHFLSINCLRSEADSRGFVIRPSLFGIELYMWANGYSDIPATRFLDESIQFINGDLLDKSSAAETFSC